MRLSLRGRPVGVQQNMEVAAVNYEARELGLYNRISVAEALRLCPHLVLVRGDNGINAMQRYVPLPCTLAHPLFALTYIHALFYTPCIRINSLS